MADTTEDLIRAELDTFNTAADRLTFGDDQAIARAAERVRARILGEQQERRHRVAAYIAAAVVLALGVSLAVLVGVAYGPVPAFAVIAAVWVGIVSQAFLTR